MTDESSVFFGDFSFLRHLWQLLLRAFRKAGGKEDTPLSERWRRRWWAQQPTWFWLEVGSKDTHNIRLSPFCLHPSPCKRKSVIPVSFWSRSWLVPWVCREEVSIWDTASLMPSVNFSSLQWHETSLLNVEQWLNVGLCKAGPCRTRSWAWQRVRRLQPQGYCAAPEVTSDGYFHFYPHNLEFLVTQQI